MYISPRQYGWFGAQLRRYVLVMGLLIIASLQGWSQRSSAKPAISASVVISQVYGGGGNSGATYKNDFVELFNRGTMPVDLSGWTLQYASFTGAFTGGANTLALTGTIAPGRYYLIQLASNAAVGADLPTPDLTGTIAMAAGAGKVALANSTTTVTGSTGANVVDFVGYGTNTNDYEGTLPTTPPSATVSINRGSNGCSDTDSNRNDFATGTPMPRNSSTAARNCGATLAASPATLTNFVATTGTDSDEQSYALTGASLSSAVTVAAPAGYAVALLSGGPYAASVTTSAPVSGNLAATVYVVLRSSTAGTITGTITNTSDASSAAVAVSGAANAPVTSTQTVYWDGGANTSFWFDAANWSSDVVPGTANDVVLDHSVVTAAYKVLLQSAATTAATVEPSVTVQSLRVNPGGGEAIGFEIPVLNTNGNALTLTRTGTNEMALAIYSKGTVTNSAGPNSSSAGAALTVAGSGPTVFIYNGGTYQHYTNRQHATVVENLAPVSGTENGRWEFRVTNTSSSVLSLSKRSYPTLVLRANLASPTTSYTGSSTGLTIRGNLLVESAVTFAPNVAGDLKIAGNIDVQGAMRFAPTTTGSPTTGQLILSGLVPQTISGVGFGALGAESYLSSGVTVQINNPSGVILAAPVVVNGALHLATGVLFTNTSNTLTLAAGATVSGGSPDSFVNGPLAYAANGPTTLRFPLGRVGVSGSNAYRPLTLAIDTLTKTTTFTATQVESKSTGSLSGSLTRVNQARYFEITPTPVLTTGEFSGTVMLSYGADDKVSNPESNSLVIAKNDNNIWATIGRSGYTGTASSGTVTSGRFRTFSGFSLASTSTDLAQNPLPVEMTTFTAQRHPTGALLRWTTAAELRSERFEIWRSADGQTFTQLGSLPGQGSTMQAQTYRYLDPTLGEKCTYYQLRQVDTDGRRTETTVRAVAGVGEALPAFYPNPVADQLTLQLPVAAAFRILSEIGQIAYAAQATAGLSSYPLTALPAGLYVLEIQLPNQPATRQKLLKR